MVYAKISEIDMQDAASESTFAPDLARWLAIRERAERFRAMVRAAEEKRRLRLALRLVSAVR